MEYIILCHLPDDKEVDLLDIITHKLEDLEFLDMLEVQVGLSVTGDWQNSLYFPSVSGKVQAEDHNIDLPQE